ncbi:exopolysaccharide biosynthesis protein [Devosia sp. CN2-171]|uniref:exopolysaccharide biosynthesis protein n=1 Tax=Devosia sp. CN2-171 TaxID=3400909 RepID=UPI003BF87177
MSPSEALAGEEDPMEAVVGGVIERLRAHAEAPDASLSCNDLLALVGPRSHLVAILLFALLNLLPAPPGYNFVMALIIIALCVSLLFKREMQLKGYFGRMQLPVKIVLKLMDVLGKLAGWAARISSPRWRGLTGNAIMPVLAIFGVVLGLFMLPPIPATNTLPSLGLAVICVGVLNHDGLVVLLGGLVGLAGIIICGFAVWVVVALSFAIGDVVDGEAEPSLPGGSPVQS